MVKKFKLDKGKKLSIDREMKRRSCSMTELFAEYLSLSDVYFALSVGKITGYIIRYRHEHGMTKNDFAKMMGISTRMVTKWESAEYDFSVREISKIAEKLQLSFKIELTPRGKEDNM